MREGLQRKWLAGILLRTVGDLLRGRSCQVPFSLIASHCSVKPDGAAAVFVCVRGFRRRAGTPK